MSYLKNKKNRFILAVLAAGTAVFLAVSDPYHGKDPKMLAWWGTIYPEFCFSEREELKEDELNKYESHKPKVKISFWLAKALDW